MPLARNDTLDGLKYGAAAAIVLHHVAAIESGGRLGAFVSASAATALFFFFAVSGYLHGGIGKRGVAWRLRRLRRLGIPYAFWSAVYLVWGQRSLLTGGRPFLPNPLLVVFFAGANGILWFLPMLLACALLCDVVVSDSRSRRVAMGLCVLVAFLLVWTGVVASVKNVTWADFVLAPAWLFTYLAGMEVRAASALPTPSLGLAALAVVAVVGVGVVRVLGGPVPSPAYETVEIVLWSGGSILVLLGAASGIKWLGVAKLAWGRDYLIGIYLSHVMWLVLFIALVSPNSMNPALWIPVAWAFTFTGASLTTWVLKSIPLTRPVVI